MSNLIVHSIFRSIQGEGPFTGTPAVFIRLYGCNLNCLDCDTDFLSSKASMETEQIVQAVRNLQEGNLVVITGGEPCAQDTTELCLDLINNGYFIQFETNGTLSFPVAIQKLCSVDIGIRRGIFIVCSPKTQKINLRIRSLICAYKYIISDADINAEDGLPNRVLNQMSCEKVARPSRGFKGLIYVQPADLKNDWKNSLNLKAAISSAMRFGYIFQLQLHKNIGVD